MSTTTISKNVDDNPYKIVREHLKLQALVDLVQDYTGYHRNVFFSLSLQMPNLIPQVVLSKPLFEWQVAESPRGFSSPYVLFERSIFSMNSGESRAIPPFPLDKLKDASTVTDAQLKDGVLLLQAYGPLATNEACSALNASFYAISDLSLICTTTRFYRGNNATKYILLTRNIAVRVVENENGCGFFVPQCNEYIFPPCLDFPTNVYDCLVDNDGAIYIDRNRVMYFTHRLSPFHFYLVSDFTRALTEIEDGFYPYALIGSHVYLRHTNKNRPCRSYDIITGSWDVLQSEMGLIDNDVLIDHNCLLFTKKHKGAFTLTIRELERKQQKPSSSSSSSSTSAKVAPSRGCCIIA